MLAAVRSSFHPSLGLRFAAAAKIDRSTNSLSFDPSKCIMCQGCVKACKNTAGIKAIKLGKDPTGKPAIVPSKGKLLADTNCIKCGQCTLQCSVGALMEKDQTQEVATVLKSSNGRIPVAQTAPAVRIALSEALGLPAGTITTGKMVTALKKLGFKYVFDTNFSADLTIMEEAAELVNRIQNGGLLPMFTSCCPAWVNYVEQSRPDLIPHLSSCKSPLSMLSALMRTEFPSRLGVDPSAIYHVAIMPCTAKKDEIERPQLRHGDVKDTDVVLTTRELSRMIKKAKIDYKTLEDTPFDTVYGESSGAGAIFGATGGVMEAAVRSAYKFITGEDLPSIDFEPARGIGQGIKIAPVKIGDKEIKIAVAHGIANAQKMLAKIGTPELDGLVFAEIMACPGGCVCGGGNTKPKTKKIMEKRLNAIYSIDKNSQYRRSHDNPEIIQLYERFLGKPLSHEAHEQLHTHYSSRAK